MRSPARCGRGTRYRLGRAAPTGGALSLGLGGAAGGRLVASVDPDRIEGNRRVGHVADPNTGAVRWRPRGGLGARVAFANRVTIEHAPGPSMHGPPVGARPIARRTALSGGDDRATPVAESDAGYPPRR